VLDLLGDRWTLLVVRDLLFFRKVRYNELADTLERIPTNILADRLRRLEAAGIVEKGAYQDRPVRYEYRLTARGMDLLPVLREMIGWAKRHIAITGKRPRIRAGRSTGSRRARASALKGAQAPPAIRSPRRPTRLEAG
jgi:DNA-binding HxlR family transcriptional regulator